MARYPPKPNRWATRTYGADADAWDEAKRQCRAVLYQWARAGRPGTYTDLAQRVTAIDWPEGAYTHHGQQMGYLLGQVSLEELDRVQDRPVLSALVIGQREPTPSGGFWTFVRDELGLDAPTSEMAKLEFWQAEFAAACRFYGERSVP